VAEYVPPGWPTGVHPPGSEEFEQTAVAWLLDVVPPDYRLHGVLRRHPVALAALARHHLAACVAGAREGYRTARAELGDRLPPGSLDAVLDAYRTEGRRLVETARAVDLVGRALRGEVFTPQMAGTQDERRSGAVNRDSTRRRDTNQQAGRPGETAPANRSANPRETAPANRSANPRETAPAKQATSPGEAVPAKQATSPGEAVPAKQATNPGEAAPAKQAANPRKAAPAKRADSPGGATPAKRGGGSRKATSAKQR
jgi:hypothetical protein